MKKSFSLALLWALTASFSMKRCLAILFINIALISNVYSQQFDEEQLEYLHEVGQLTARQTLWFFEHRLKTPLPEYRFHHVYLPFQDVWVKDIGLLPNGRFVGVVDKELPHGKGIEMLKDSIRFHPRDVGDWIIVDDYYLLGGFTLWYKSFAELRPYRRLGQFRVKQNCINADFTELSNLEEETSPVAIREDNILLDQYFEGGTKAFFDSLKAKIAYPEYASLLGIEGYVTMKFKLNGSGELEDMTVIRGIGCGLHEEFMHAVKELQPFFHPDPDKKDVDFTIPFHFIILPPGIHER